MKKLPRDYLALALDNCSEVKAIQRLVHETDNYIGVFKIGLELFTRFGPDVLEALRASGRRVFLDLKLHDIPNTVRKAVSAAAEHNVDYLTVHTQGGPAMLRAAVQGAAQAAHRPKIIGVTLLTSIDEQSLQADLSVALPAREYVRRLGELATEAKLDGIVCSAADLSTVKPSLPQSFEVITPGIRMSEHSADDQKRVAGPEAAIAAGSTLLVIGRPITAAPDPQDAARRFEKCVADTVGDTSAESG